MVVAVSVGRDGIDLLLVASQVVLSITLPFITFPLIYCTSSKAIMSVRVPPSETASTFQTSKLAEGSRTQIPTSPSVVSSNGGTLLHTNIGSSQMDSITELARPQYSTTFTEKAAPDQWIDYSNSIYTTALGSLIWTIIVAANFYVIIALAMGDGI